MSEKLGDGVFKFKTVAEDWRLFSKAIELEKTDPVQQREMRIGYYAGYIAAFGQMVFLSNNYTEDEASVFLSKLGDELDDYCEEIK